MDVMRTRYVKRMEKCSVASSEVSGHFVRSNSILCPCLTCAIPPLCVSTSQAVVARATHNVPSDLSRSVVCMLFSPCSVLSAPQTCLKAYNKELL